VAVSLCLLVCVRKGGRGEVEKGGGGEESFSREKLLIAVAARRRCGCYRDMVLCLHLPRQADIVTLKVSGSSGVG